MKFSLGMGDKRGEAAHLATSPEAADGGRRVVKALLHPQLPLARDQVEIVLPKHNDLGLKVHAKSGHEIPQQPPCTASPRHRLSSAAFLVGKLGAVCNIPIQHKYRTKRCPDASLPLIPITAESSPATTQPRESLRGAIVGGIAAGSVNRLIGIAAFWVGEERVAAMPGLPCPRQAAARPGAGIWWERDGGGGRRELGGLRLLTCSGRRPTDMRTGLMSRTFSPSTMLQSDCQETSRGCRSATAVEL